MSRTVSVTIVGAGQSGLQLAIGLIGHGYQVRVISDRTGTDIAGGQVTSSQCMFATALNNERLLGLDLWADEAPDIDGVSFSIPAPPDSLDAGGKAIDWSALLDTPAQSVDQRVKMPRFIDEFIRRGGEFVVEEAGIADLERYARESDLVIVAAGKGEIAKAFIRDDQRSTFDKPQRALALSYVHGMVPRPEFSAVVYNVIPGIGEYFVFPALTLTGPCEIMVFEGVPGGPMDHWNEVKSPEEHLEHSKQILRSFVPWEAERCENISLTDDLGIVSGRFPPTVRHPVATLPSGAHVLGMADVVVLNDPLTGQGANNASKCAASYLSSILGHGDRSFDHKFMQETFENYWEYAYYVSTWTNFMLTPPPPHAIELLTAAQHAPEIATRFGRGFDNARDFFDWYMDPDQAGAYLAQLVTSP
ncbi:FAD-binding oxidoreductase [Mycobacterium sp. CBMA271]|uniref:styrene monooxygenase/indole monooxygenase family protein n=1 Tax=unclassified Mycobacteroides TaxID=2618759 RepID=UPI0012DF024D|nr:MULTISPECIES: styrene monooxygenase/indole monooxygenase family protein [unclassified Mycobacteroides]MUM18849.1 alanine-phosphoribitol ligase [Mycobacteroides sp. CBMA 326]MUM23211.1 FAD-binding oxidoreductase [Mycobacteroides sp. CBMA 271]